ncbi:hypothetical protein PHMEG_00013975 [Phytophthora megakarya]|uniref:SWIM-type domain-containing protein n=1 Tax=Phytophthora megakarya TaxID=4795 RepID=A0A225W526_9STRA|nr:hypothetical protein PHMEG_00013975 [Phytophthora megakarya]
MQIEGMPVTGWIVDATTRACQCRFHFKYNVCPHVIEATKVVGLPCPGMPDPVRRFVSRARRARQKTNRPPSTSQPTNHQDQPSRAENTLTARSADTNSSGVENQPTTDIITTLDRAQLPTLTYGSTAMLDDVSIPAFIRCPEVPVLRVLEYDQVLDPPVPVLTHSDPVLIRTTLRDKVHNATSGLNAIPTNMTGPVLVAEHHAMETTDRESCPHTKRRRF